MDILTKQGRAVLDGLLRRNIPSLRRLASGFVGCVDAQDAVQEACVRLLVAAPVVEHPRRWLVRATASAAIDLTRRERVRTGRGELGHEPESLPAREPSPESAAVTAAELRRLAGVLSGLPDRQREALLLSRVDGLSHLAIAARQGVSPKTVERDIIEALRRCVEGLADDDPDGA